MPGFVSKSQQRLFGAMMGRGEISKHEFEKRAAETDFKKLPERKRKVGKSKARGGFVEPLAGQAKKRQKAYARGGSIKSPSKVGAPKVKKRSC